MKEINKHSKLAIMLVMLLLAILGIVNVTYSYFTSTSNSAGEMVFGDLNVKFVYQTGSSDSYISTQNEAVLELYSATGTIARGVPFQLALTAGGAAIKTVAMQNSATSCDAYIRFWIDAYVVKDDVVDKSVNYGKYFLLNTSTYYTNNGSSVAGSTCYFGVEPMSASYVLDIGNTLTLTDLSATDTVPAQLLGEQIQITISFEAAQVANNGFIAAFDQVGDTKGYYTGWVID